MDIADLQNVDDDAADWDFKASDGEELDGDTGSPTTVDEKDVATEPDNEAAPGAGLTPPTKRRTGNAYVDGIIQESGLHIIRDKEAEATVYELDAYIGLEIAMSFNPFTEIKDFAATVGRNRFESIRARFQVHAPGSVSVERREEDPLWHSRRLMALIQAKLAAIAVPVGAESLDENTVRTNARSAAKTYMPSKPD
ncbi:Chromosome transmission fidelity protein 8 [Phytophthora cinnamomi]|uniref:Chromosome transmission fidelity protein 8 n=1 Tax=Phytophthora cinnamomi TaxID=4785 RepID=UPI0035598A40|nr:Chromosome transmission fidelity protein 8 [Phytophthora cinnamomi]